MFGNEENGIHEEAPPVCNPPVEPVAAPTEAPPVNPFIKPLPESELTAVNNIIREAEKLTASMLNAWNVRNQLRQVVANMVCPWPVGTVILINGGAGPKDRRVVTAILPGRTEEGEFYRVKTRVLKKGSSLGKQEYALRLEPGMRIDAQGMFPGVMPEREVIEETREV